MPDPFSEDSPRLVAEAMPGDNSAPESVGELSNRLKRMVEGEFGRVRLRGEISGYKRAASGHVYLCLKDDAAVIDGVMWKGQAAMLPFAAQDGIEVIATRQAHDLSGPLQIPDRDRPDGAGGRGRVDGAARKAQGAIGRGRAVRPGAQEAAAVHAAVIGVVTSPTGAVIRDILHRLADRCPTHVIVWPVKVQGAGAAEEVAAAVRGFDAIAAGRPGAAPRSGHRRARRRVDRGSVGVQRGSRGARGRRLLDPDHLGGRARDRHQPVRLRRRSARADPDRGGRDRGAGARRPAAGARRLRASAPNAARGAMSSAGASGVEAQARLLPKRDALLGPQRQRADDAGAAARPRARTPRDAWRAGTLDRTVGALRPALLDPAYRRRARSGSTRPSSWSRRSIPAHVLDRGYALVTDARRAAC